MAVTARLKGCEHALGTDISALVLARPWVKLWKHSRAARVPIAFSSSPKLSRVFPWIDRNPKNMFSFSFIKQREERKENNLLTLVNFSLLASSLYQQLECASSLSPSSYRNTTFKQSARVVS